MNIQKLLILGAVSAVGFSGFSLTENSEPASSTTLASRPEKAEANRLLDKYIQAFQTRSFALASEVYAHDSDLVVYGSYPSDRRFGWGQTEEYLKNYFAAVDRIEITLKERHLKVHESGNVAWFAQVLTWVEIERGNTYTMDGLRITGVLEKRDAGWVIVQLHASGPPPTS